MTVSSEVYFPKTKYFSDNLRGFAGIDKDTEPIFFYATPSEGTDSTKPPRRRLNEEELYRQYIDPTLPLTPLTQEW